MGSRQENRGKGAGEQQSSSPQSPAPSRQSLTPLLFQPTTDRFALVYFPPTGETSATVIVLSLKLPVTFTDLPPRPLNLS